MEKCSFLWVLNNFMLLSNFMETITARAEGLVFLWKFFSLWSPGEMQHHHAQVSLPLSLDP